MALPPAIQTVTIAFGPFLDFQGTPLRGETTFEPSTPVRHDATGTPILNRPITVVWDADGMGAVVLPATDSVGLDRTGFTYRVSHRTYDNGVPAPVGTSISLPATAPNVDLDLLVPSTASNGVVIAQPELTAVAGLTGAPSAQEIVDALDVALRAALVARWRPNTAYTAGDVVLAPSGETVQAIASFTSGATYDPHKWLPKLVRTTPWQLIFDGDSITEGAGSTAGRTYPAQATEGLDARSVVRNFGVGGQTVIMMLGDAATQIDPLFDPTRINVVLALGGTNDLSYFDGTRSAATIYADIVSYHQGRRAAGFKTVAFTILPASASQPVPNWETRRAAINTLIRANWQTFADAFADVASDPNIGPAGAADNTTYYADGVHPNNVGYAIVARYAREALGTLGVVGGHDHPQYDITTSRFIGADEFTVRAGAATLTFKGPMPVWLFGPDAGGQITTSFDPPAGWSRMAVDLWWCNHGAGSGDVRWNFFYTLAVIPGGTFSAAPSTFVTVPAGIDGVVVKSRPPITGDMPLTAGALTVLQVGRGSSNADDTLPNDAAFIGMWLRKIL